MLILCMVTVGQGLLGAEQTEVGSFAKAVLWWEDGLVRWETWNGNPTKTPLACYPCAIFWTALIGHLKALTANQMYSFLLPPHRKFAGRYVKAFKSMNFEAGWWFVCFNK